MIRCSGGGEQRLIWPAFRPPGLSARKTRQIWRVLIIHQGLWQHLRVGQAQSIAVFTTARADFGVFELPLMDLNCTKKDSAAKRMRQNSSKLHPPQLARNLI